MKVMLVGDIHVSDRAPSIRTDAYLEQILDKLDQTAGLAYANAVDAVAWAGDVFHIKTPSRTSHYAVRRVAEIGQKYEVPWFIVPGNHDMQHDRLDSLDKGPLGVLFKAGAIPLIGNVEAGNVTLFGVPWLYDWKKDLPAYMKDWQKSDAPLMVTHAPIVKPGESRPFEVIDATDWAKVMKRPGEVYYGHMHDPDGAYEAGGSTFCNQGAISRGSLHESTLRREPAVTVWETGEGFARCPLAFLPASEVFTLEEKEIEDGKVERLSEFLAQVDRTELVGLSVEAVLDHVKGLDLSDLTRSQIEECLEVAMSA